MKLKIKPRLIFGFLIMGILLVILGISAIFYTNRMQKNTHRILVENVSSLKAAEELEIALLDMKGLTANYLLNSDLEWLQIFAEKQKSFRSWFETARRRTFTKDEKIILNEIESLFNRYINLQNQVVQLYSSGKSSRAQNLLFNDMLKTFNSIFEKCEELLSLNEQLMETTSTVIAKDNKSVNFIMNGIGIVGILVGLFLSIFLSRSITHPIDRLVLKLKNAAGTEFIEEVDISDETEIDNLDKHIKNLIEKVHQTNRDLEMSQQLLIRSEKLAALGKMAAGLAHEIRNPLTAIKMLIFSLQTETKNFPHLTKDYQVVIKEITRIENFIENFLNFARPPKPKLSETNIREILNPTLELLAPQIKKMKIEIIDLITGNEPSVYADKSLLQQVFVNIILNAIQSMNAGGKIEINALTDKVKKNQKILQINFCDTGEGIDPEIIDNIFDPFVTKKEDGTGLGLSIAHQIINNHGGWIQARNNNDQGATFSINLPVEPKNES